MLTSIIIDNYNYGRFLREAIDSALAQTHRDIEVIVVDDGSTDDSREVIASYGHRIRPLFKANGGQASALNAGFSASHGQIVLFLDSDDVLVPTAVAEAVALFDNKISKVHWPLWVINESGEKTGAIKPGSSLPEGDFREAVLNGGPSSCLSAPTSGNAWARHFLEQVMPIPEDVAYYRVCADEYLYTLAPILGKIKACRTPLGSYRMHGRNIYSAHSFEKKLELELSGHEEQCRALGATLQRLGFQVDTEAWRKTFWFRRLQTAAEEIRRIVPRGERFILVDDDTWSAQDVFKTISPVPFLEKAGTYWGPPVDDAMALHELARLQQTGIRFIVFAWPSFWWLEHYRKFAAYLKAQARCRLENDRLIIFELTPCHSGQGQPLKHTDLPPFPELRKLSQTPLVSIIINNYNYGRFLKDAIDSALAQTYSRVEVIVVDDGSTDNSRDVIASFGDRVIPVFKDNGGQASTYNAGFVASHGDIICYLDADDTLYPTVMERAAQLLEMPDTVKAQWPLVVIDKAGRPTGELSTKRNPPDGDLRERVLREGPIYDFLFTTGSAYSRFFLEKVLPMPEPPYRNGADVYLITLAPIFGQLRTAAQPLGTYRSHGSNNYWGRVLDDERVKNYLSRFEMNCSVVHEHLAKLGIRADPEQWKRQNFNCLWPQRLLAAKQDLAGLIPPGTSYILVNQDEWGEGEPLAGRHAIPFLEHDGEYFGPPADDAAAIAEVQRLRDAGAFHMAFWWTAFWWLGDYPGFQKWLRETFHCSLENDRLVVFDLRHSSPLL